MANTKYLLEKIKIGTQIEDLIARSDGENVSVTYNGSDMKLSDALAVIYASVSAQLTSDAVDKKIKDAIDKLINGAGTAYDTLKEIEDLMKEHDGLYQALLASVGEKASKDDLTALEEKVDGLGKLAAKDSVSESDLDKALADKVNAASDGNHSHTNRDLLETITQDKIAAWDNKAEKDPATESANGLMSSDDKKRLNALRGVVYGSGDAPATMLDGELYVRVVSA